MAGAAMEPGPRLCHAPTPGRREHFPGSTEHIRPEIEHISPRTEHIQPKTEHIGSDVVNTCLDDTSRSLGRARIRR